MWIVIITIYPSATLSRISSLGELSGCLARLGAVPGFSPAGAEKYLMPEYSRVVSGLKKIWNSS